MAKAKKISLSKVLKGVGKSARRKAFKDDRPVAISENGEALLLYRDGTKRKIDDEVLQKLTDANS